MRGEGVQQTAKAGTALEGGVEVEVEANTSSSSSSQLAKASETISHFTHSHTVHVS